MARRKSRRKNAHPEPMQIPGQIARGRRDQYDIHVEGDADQFPIAHVAEPSTDMPLPVAKAFADMLIYRYNNFDKLIKAMRDHISEYEAAIIAARLPMPPEAADEQTTQGDD